jgi:hypothetical protein
MFTIQNEETMKDKKYDLLDEQVNKIDDVIKVLTEKFGDNFEDELNYLAIVKANIEEAAKK